MFASTLWIHKADVAVLSVYACLIIIAGLWSAVRIRNAAHYCGGHSRVGGVLALLFGFGAGTNRDEGLTSIAGSLQQGPTGILWQILWLPVIPVFWLIAPLLRRLRANTTADFFGARFGSQVATLYSCYAIGIAIVVMAATLFSGGKLINSLVGESLDDVSATLRWEIPSIRLVPTVSPEQRQQEGTAIPAGRVFSVKSRRVAGYEYAVIGTAALLAVFALSGGLSAVVVSSAIQGAVIVGVTLVLIPLVLSAASRAAGLENAASLAERFTMLYSPTSSESVSPFYIGVLCVTVLAGFIVQPQVMAVCRIGRTETDGRIGLTFGNLLGRFVIVSWIVAGTALIHRPEVQQKTQQTKSTQFAAPAATEATSGFHAMPRSPRVLPGGSGVSLIRKIKTVLPGRDLGALGLVVAGLIAVMLSVCSVQMVVAGGMFAENVYKRVFFPGLSEEHYLFIARFGSVLILVAALVLQATFSGLLNALRLVVMVPAAMGISMWFGLFWRRWNSQAVWSSVIGSFATWFVTSTYPEPLSSLLPEWMFYSAAGQTVMLESWQSLLYLAMGVGLGVLTSLMTWPESDQQLDNVFTLLRTPVQQKEDCTSPCVIPPDSDERDAVFEFGAWQIPRPTRLDVIGFAVAWLTVLLIAGMAVLACQRF